MIDESALAARMFGATTPSETAARPESTADAADRMFPEQAAQPTPKPARANAHRVVHDGRGGLRTQAGLPVPPRQGQAHDPADAEAQLAARQYGPTNDADGNPITPLEAIAADMDDETRAFYEERDLLNFGGPADTGESRLAVDRAIEQIDPGLPADLKTAAVATYVRFASASDLSAEETATIAREAQAAFANGSPDADTLSRWSYTSSNILREYGGRANAVLAEAQTVIRGDKRVQQMLNRTGLGSHPSVVRATLRAADQRLKGRGK